MHKKKIAIFNERMIRGHGVDVVVDHTARALVDAGYEVTVYALFADDSYINSSYQIEVLAPLPRTNISRVVGKFISSMAANDIDVFFSRKRFNDIEADLFIINSYPFFPLLSFARTPCIVVEYGVASSKYLAFRHKVNSWYAKFSQRLLFLGQAHMIISISDFLKFDLPVKLQKKTQTVYLGGDTYRPDILSPKTDKKYRLEHGILDSDVAFLYVGRANTSLRSYKDIHELIEMFQKISQNNKQIKLVIAGYGDKKDATYLTGRGVIPILNAPADELAQIYSMSDVYTSATKWEGFNLPLAEAQFFGKPVIAYNIGPHKELVQEGKSGFLVENVLEFITKVELLGTDMPLREKMSMEAKIQGEKFTWEKTTNGFVECVSSVLYE